MTAIQRLVSRVAALVIAISITLIFLTRSVAMILPANSIELIHGEGIPTHTIIWLHITDLRGGDIPQRLC